MPADYDGVVIDIHVKEGESVAEGKVFATLEIDEVTSEKETKKTAEKIVKDETIQINSKNHQKEETDSENFKNFEGANAGPAVRKISRELGIDLSKILGTGKNGFITKDDVKNYIHSLSSEKAQSYADLSELESFGDFVLENQTKIRKIGAKTF